MSTSVYYQGGTLVLKNPDSALTPPEPFQWIKGHWRCEGVHYGALIDWFRQQAIRDTVPRWGPLDLTLHDVRQPHAYQDAALAAWETAGYRGSIVLPTGAGKTFVALHAIHRTDRSAVVVAPTRSSIRSV